MKYYSYENFRNDTNKLLEDVKRFNPDAIIGIARGGLTLAHMLAEGLNIRNVQTLQTQLYDGMQQREDITVIEHCFFTKEIKKVLIVDDIADSGKTLYEVLHILEAKYPHIQFQTATLFYKRSSVYEPHFWVKEANEWIEFFWEKDYSCE